MNILINNSWLVIWLLIGGFFVGFFKGAKARQKWVFKLKYRFLEKQQEQEEKKVLRSGGVVLDDVEIAAFHR